MIKNNWQTKKTWRAFCHFFKKNKLKVPYISQVNDAACGPAVLEMVYKYYGIANISQENIFNKYKEFEPLGSGNYRLTTVNLVNDALGMGFSSFWARADYNDKEKIVDLLRRLVIDSKIPLIVCQKFTNEQPQLGHFRIVVGMKNNIVYIHDPHVKDGGAFKEWSIDKFMEFWKPTGSNVTGGIFIVIKKL